MTDTTTTVHVGLPVLVTYNATLGTWEVEVDMAEFTDAVAEAAYGAVDADADTVIAAWQEACGAWAPKAVAPIRFVPKEDQ